VHPKKLSSLQAGRGRCQDVREPNSEADFAETATWLRQNHPAQALLLGETVMSFIGALKVLF